jgi:carbon-monoxide dehydrogenase medium subunit
MKFPAFAYVAPTTIAEALAALADDDEARPLAGGQTLLPILALRMSTPTCLVDLNGIDALKQITLAADTVTVGAMVTHAENAASAIHREHVPLLYEAVPFVAHDAVRNRGTIGGSIAYADAAAEMPLVALALDATMIIAGADGERRVAAEDFFLGHYTTAIGEGELLTAIEFPRSDHRWAFEEVARRPGDFALVMAAAGARINEGHLTDVRIALGSVADRPVRASAAEAFLEGKAIAAATLGEAARLATADLRSHGDIHASADYRRDVGARLVARALNRLCEGAA